MADDGDYTCVFTEPRQTFHIKLVVGTCPKPNLRILGPTKDGMLLRCEVRGASPKPKVEWKDSSGNKLPAEELQGPDRGGLYDIILQTTVTKTDNYSCVSTQDRICHQISADTYVPVNGPTVISVYEGDAAPLPCSLSTKKNIESEMFEWKKDGQKEVFLYDAGTINGRAGQSEEFIGRVFHFPDNLKHGDASITIRNTKVTDSGNYTCDFPHLQPRQTFHIELEVVETGNSSSGANSSVNSGSGANSSGLSIGLIVGIVVLAILLIGVILAVLVDKGYIPLKRNKGSPADHIAGSAVPLKSQPSRSQEAPDPET
ncbi:uncharacterized protein LOC126385698 isoform X2 [Epinephelus moara]|uniref:uncharacterized protein LOC126385698 isoform X2 n=1 Tax=Epinephelus moara TaxID=300413 RepID=UPI00214E933B|nr:uncharacterized protein LOC126385698 isoform X2 [Epinephelus moara]